jgi:hypothetical protein
MMAAGVTDHVWTLQELLKYRVPPRAPENIVSIDEGHQTFLKVLLVLEINLSIKITKKTDAK